MTRFIGMWLVVRYDRGQKNVLCRCSAVAVRNKLQNMTRKDTTSYREKGRAVFLSAIMVLSMVAGSAALAGTAAATAPSDELVGANNFDGLSDDIRYEGQTFNVTFDTSSSPTWGDENKVYIAEVDSRNDSGIVDGFGSVTTVQNTSDSNGTMVAEIDLDGADSGEYVISNRSTASSAGVSAPFSVQPQDLSVNFEDDSVTNTDNASVLELDSDRVSTDYNITVSVSGPDTFDADMIEDVFDAQNGTVATVTNSDDLPLDELDYDREGGDGIDELRDDGYVTLNLSASNYSEISNDELLLNFTKLEQDSGLPDAGEYEFEVISTDTGATATDTIQISESDESASFTQGAITDTAGDIATFEFELEDTDETWIQIGDESSDFVDVLYVQADDDSEPVTVDVNTRLLGTDASNLSTAQVYDTENADTIESAFHSKGLSNVPENANLFGDDGSNLNNSYSDYIVDDLGIANNETKQLTRPLQPTDYEIQIAGTDVDSDESMFDADTGGEATDQLASAVLELQTPEIGDITVHTAPDENADDETEVSELVDAATVREEIALDDRLVVQVEATGIYGALVAGPDGSSYDPDWDRLSDGVDTQVLHNLETNTNESITFEVIAEETTGNQDALEVQLNGNSNSDTFIVLDEENGQFFLIADTSSNNAFANGDAPDEETSFTANLEYDADNDDNRYKIDPNYGAFSEDGNSENYPYLLQGETLSSSTELSLAPRSVNFDNMNVDDVLEAENIEDSEISGTTNLAPGTDSEIRVSSADSASSSFRNGQTVNISEDGTISAEFDFSDQEVEDEFSTIYRVGGSSVDSVDSMIVEEGSLNPETPEDDESEDDESEDDESDDGMSDDGTSSDDSTDNSSDDSTEEETPGFGALVALVAVLAALLATRRQN